MSYLVHWTDNATAGLEKAYLFLADKSEEAAIGAIKAIREKVLLLEQFPNALSPDDDM